MEKFIDKILIGIMTIMTVCIVTVSIIATTAIIMEVYSNITIHNTTTQVPL